MHGTGGGQGAKTSQIASFTSRVGDHSPKLSQAVASGSAVSGEIAISGILVLKLAGAYVTSYSLSAGGDPIESWSIVFEPVASP